MGTNYTIYKDPNTIESIEVYEMSCRFKMHGVDHMYGDVSFSARLRPYDLIVMGFNCLRIASYFVSDEAVLEDAVKEAMNNFWNLQKKHIDALKEE